MTRCDYDAILIKRNVAILNSKTYHSAFITHNSAQPQSFSAQNFYSKPTGIFARITISVFSVPSVDKKGNLQLGKSIGPADFFEFAAKAGFYKAHAKSVDYKL